MTTKTSARKPKVIPCQNCGKPIQQTASKGRKKINCDGNCKIEKSEEKKKSLRRPEPNATTTSTPRLCGLCSNALSTGCCGHSMLAAHLCQRPAFQVRLSGYCPLPSTPATPTNRK